MCVDLKPNISLQLVVVNQCAVLVLKEQHSEEVEMAANHHRQHILVMMLSPREYLGPNEKCLVC